MTTWHPDIRPACDLAAVLGVLTHNRTVDAEFVRRALAVIEADRSAVDTGLIATALPAFPAIDLYFKDEAAWSTGSLKHRLARALFIHALVSGRLRRDAPVVESSSGSTAISVAHYARLIGLPFHAVVPAATSRAKIAAIRAIGGICHFATGASAHAEASALAVRLGGVFLDQFTNAERVTDWRRDNVGEALLAQMSTKTYPVPRWIVAGLGTGGTATTLGRFVRLRGLPTQVCAADPERSAFFAGYAQGDMAATCALPSLIEGVGRPRVERSFVPEAVDAVVKVPDAVSLAGMRIATDLLGKRVGPSTGLNFVVCAVLAQQLARSGAPGSIATLICDGGERYADTAYDRRWLDANKLLAPSNTAERTLRQALL